MSGPSIIMNYQITQEKQAACRHEGKLNYELVFGKRTGDRICPHCGRTFSPGEEILPVEFRCQLIMTPPCSAERRPPQSGSGAVP